MPVHSIVRDSFLGDVVRLVSRRRLLRHPEEYPDFVIPEKLAASIDVGGARRPSAQVDSESSTLNERPPRDSLSDGSATAHGHGRSDVAFAAAPNAEKGKANVEQVERQADDNDNSGTVIVDWYGPDDPECPRNVSTRIRGAVQLLTHPTVVVRKALLRDIQHLPSHLQHLHRLSHLRPRESSSSQSSST